MRIYDTRLGRFLSVDPLTRKYPWYTPYQFAGNMPIWAIDIDGGEPGRNSSSEPNTVKEAVSNYVKSYTNNYGRDVEKKYINDDPDIQDMDDLTWKMTETERAKNQVITLVAQDFKKAEAGFGIAPLHYSDA